MAVSTDRSKSNAPLPPFLIPLAAVALLLVVVGAKFLIASDVNPTVAASGVVVTDTATYDFGAVPINGGLLATRFPLTVGQAVTVTGLGTTWMCTNARLVEADRQTAWFGMPMPNAPLPPANFELRPGRAQLEVTIDPAAHGDKGVGPITRGVRLTTSAGQTLDFELRAKVLPQSAW